MPICIRKARGGHQESSSILAGWLLVDLTQFRQVRAFRETASIRMICRQERLCDTFSISLSLLSPEVGLELLVIPCLSVPNAKIPGVYHHTQRSAGIFPSVTMSRGLSRPPAPVHTATVSLRGSDPSRGLPVAFSRQA